MAARASHWDAGDAAGLDLVLRDEAEAPVPLAGGDALAAPRRATAHSVTRPESCWDLRILLDIGARILYVRALGYGRKNAIFSEEAKS